MITSFTGEYRWLSNFWYSPVKFDDGYVYPTVENAYQAAKTLDMEWRAQFERYTPEMAKKMGNIVPIRDCWDDIKLRVMSDLLYKKFTDNARLRRKLLDTGTEILIEGNNWGDRYWGMTMENNELKGSNNLGLLLMEVREFLSK